MKVIYTLTNLENPGFAKYYRDKTNLCNGLKKLLPCKCEIGYIEIHESKYDRVMCEDSTWITIYTLTRNDETYYYRFKESLDRDYISQDHCDIERVLEGDLPFIKFSD